MKYQEPTKLVDYGSMPKLPQLELDRTAKAPLAEQIRNGIECAAMAEPRAFSARRSRMSLMAGPNFGQSGNDRCDQQSLRQRAYHRRIAVQPTRPGDP
jgi:hypothetical protein